MSELNLVTVGFHGDLLEAAKGDGNDLWVPIRRPCEALGLAPNGQIEKLKGKPWARDKMILSRDASGRLQELYAIHIDSVPLWLVTIDSNRVREEIRPKLELYQKEAARVLRDHFFGIAGGDPLLDCLKSQVALRESQLLVERKATLATREAGEAKRIAQAAMDTVNSRHGYISVLGYARLKGMEMPVQTAARHGKRLTQICRGLGSEIGHVKDERFGRVNIYPESIVQDYFERQRRA